MPTNSNVKFGFYRFYAKNGPTLFNVDGVGLLLYRFGICIYWRR